MKTCTVSILILWSLTAAAGSFEKTIPVGGKADVTVSTRSGDLVITAWDRKEVKIRAADDLDDVLKVDGDQIRIGPESQGAWGIDEDVTVHLPADAQLKAGSVSGDIVIEGVNGRIKVSVVSGDVRIKSCKSSVTIKTVSGKVEVDKIGDGLNVKGVSGNLTGTDIQGGLVEAKTVSGEITLKQIKASQVRLKSVSGNIELQGQFPADGQVKASTLSGDVTIALPPGAGFELSAKTRSGSASTDFALKAVEKSSGKLSGKAGAGGTDIDLGSFSGDLRVKQKK